MTSPGRRFAESLTAKDETALRAILTPDVDFRALTPRRPWEATTCDGVLAVVFGSWFDSACEFVAAPDVRDDPDVADTQAVGYRMQVREEGVDYVVEQHAYYRCDAENRIDYLRVLCSGFRPVD